MRLLKWASSGLLLLMLGLGCAHSPSPAPHAYVITDSAEGVGASLATGGAGGRDCQAEHEACFRECWRKSRPPYPHKHDEWYYKRCTADCGKAYNDCVDEVGEQTASAQRLEFESVHQARKWLLEHKSEVALGTLVIVGGTGFMLTIGAAGALILAPLAL
ncbi:hypothetical protein [Corallococcus sp. AB045]|uniref:hypothetical protein n=1 Tax=Corallococcus sp. AB045 TaxID=2316719 RepID=UPI001F171B51|nr:hypothetical protein [Corallococcus sp. AB045]